MTTKVTPSAGSLTDTGSVLIHLNITNFPPSKISKVGGPAGRGSSPDYVKIFIFHLILPNFSNPLELSIIFYPESFNKKIK